MGATPSVISPSPGSSTLADQVFLRLREAIVSGDLVPGERILEPALAARFGVSRERARQIRDKALGRLRTTHALSGMNVYL